MDNKPEPNTYKELSDYQARFTRWQQISISQLSVTNNLFLSLTTGLLAFSVTQIDLKVTTNCLLTLGLIFSYIFLFTALITGVSVTINRLMDFRKTMDLVWQRKKKFEIEMNIKVHGDIDKIKRTIIELKIQTNKHGKDTWELLNWQIYTFIIGAVFMITVIVLTKNHCGT